MLQRPVDLLLTVDLARAQALDKILDGQIKIDDLVGLPQKRVGDGFADDDLRCLLDQVVQAFQVLHVESADDIDSGGQKLENVLVPFAIPASGDVGVRQFIDHRDLRMSFKRRVKIHLLHRHAAVLYTSARNDFQSIDERFGLRTTVSLDKSQDNVHTP